MPRNITPQDEFTSPVQVADDGEDVDSASLELCAQSLANRTRWVERRTVGGSIELVQSVPLVPSHIDLHDDDAPAWIASSGGLTGFSWRQIYTSSAYEIVFPVNTPPLSTSYHPLISYCAVSLQGVGHIRVPEVVPTWTLYSQPSEEMETIEIASKSVGVATPANYNTRRLYPVSGLEHPLDFRSSYWIKVTGATGDDAAANLYITGIFVGFQLTEEG